MKLESMKTMGVMLASLSHEINNPLAITIGSLELISASKEFDNIKVDKALGSARRIVSVVKEIEGVIKEGTLKTEQFSKGQSKII